MEFPTLSPLPILLSALSVSHRTFASIAGPSTTTANPAPSSALDAYASSPQRSDFFRVLIWMLTHDLLVMLHVRVRIYIPRDIKVAALKTQREEKEQREARKAKKIARSNGYKESSWVENGGNSTYTVLKTHSSASIRSSTSRLAPTSSSRSPHPSGSGNLSRSRSHSLSRRQTRAPHHKHKPAVSFDKTVSVEKPSLTSAPSMHGESSESNLNDEDDLDEDEDEDEDEEESDDDGDPHDNGPPHNGVESGSGGAQGTGRRGSKQSSELETSELEEEEETDLTPSFLIDPERATRAQRRWLDEICRGHDPFVVKGLRRQGDLSRLYSRNDSFAHLRPLVS